MSNGDGTGPSLPIFLQLYEQRCIDFDSVYAWEATPHNSSWWDTVPLTVRSKLHFYNVPVTEPRWHGGWRKDGWQKDPSSFLAMLNETARPEDFVAVKIDIEGQLGPSPELQKLLTAELGGCQAYHLARFEDKYWGVLVCRASDPHLACQRRFLLTEAATCHNA